MKQDMNDPARWVNSCYASCYTSTYMHKGKLSYTHASKQSMEAHTHTHTLHLPCAVRVVLHTCLPNNNHRAAANSRPLLLSTPASIPSLAYATYRDFSTFFFFLLTYNAAAAPPRTITAAAAAARRGNCFLESVEEGMAMHGRRRLPQLLSVLFLRPVPVSMDVRGMRRRRRSGGVRNTKMGRCGGRASRVCLLKSCVQQQHSSASSLVCLCVCVSACCLSLCMRRKAEEAKLVHTHKGDGSISIINTPPLAPHPLSHALKTPHRPHPAPRITVSRQSSNT